MEKASRQALEDYFKGRFGECRLVEFSPLGKGVHGMGFLASLETPEGRKSYVLKSIAGEGLGHDYPSDRAGMLLLALDNYGKLPNHIKALDVLSLQGDGSLRSIGGGREYYLLMEQARGTSYFVDLEGFSKKTALDEPDKKKISLMAEYLKEIHSRKKDSKTLYLRKLRDIIGHGECLMGVFDTYPEGVLGLDEMAEIEKSCIDWRARLKSKYKRLSEIHGDFHPGNIWFEEEVAGAPPNIAGGRAPNIAGGRAPNIAGGRAPNIAGGRSPNIAGARSPFILLDRSRGEWGEPADDLTALAINYIFFSIKHFNELGGAYLEGFKLFFERYLKLTGDDEALEVSAPFFAFRGAVVANPVFYPELTNDQRRLILGFVRATLADRRFSPERVGDYIEAGKGTTKTSP